MSQIVTLGQRRWLSWESTYKNQAHTVKRQDRMVPGARGSASLTESVISKYSERHCLKSKVVNDWGEHNTHTSIHAYHIKIFHWLKYRHVFTVLVKLNTLLMTFRIWDYCRLVKVAFLCKDINIPRLYINNFEWNNEKKWNFLFLNTVLPDSSDWRQACLLPHLTSQCWGLQTHAATLTWHFSF